MSAEITIFFAGGSATGERVSILVTQGSVQLAGNAGLIVELKSGFANVSATSSEVAFATSAGAKFAGTLALVIEWQTQEVPAVTLNNLSNAANMPTKVTWPTKEGPQTQILTPGNPMPLSGIVNV